MRYHDGAVSYLLSLGNDHEIRLTPGQWRIGRDPACEIRVNDDAVSRRHASLRVHEAGIELTDHGSRNGVRVNDERVYGSVELKVGDRLSVGPTTFELKKNQPTEWVESATKPMPKVPRRGDESLELLSPREREVFGRLARGQTQREVAEALGLSVKTVETYRARIGDKLGLRTRAQLVDLALKTGVLHA